MHMALNVNVQLQDGTLVLTSPAGKTVTFSKEQTVQKKVSMITWSFRLMRLSSIDAGFRWACHAIAYNSKGS